MKFILSFIFSILSLVGSYEISSLKYTNNNIKFRVMPCPYNIDCTSLIFNAMSECNVPGSYRNFIWEFSNNPFEKTDHNGINNIIFKSIQGGSGYTRFSIDVNNRDILEVDVTVDPTGMDELNIYNILLHELCHVMLLRHGEKTDSVMGYSVNVDLFGTPILTYDKLYVTQDDCQGIYMKLITDMIYYDHIYAIKLNNMMIKYCNELPHNIISEVYNIPQFRTNGDDKIDEYSEETDPSIKIVNTTDYYDIIYT